MKRKTLFACIFMIAALAVFAIPACMSISEESAVADPDDIGRSGEVISPVEILSDFVIDEGDTLVIGKAGVTTEYSFGLNGKWVFRDDSAIRIDGEFTLKGQSTIMHFDGDTQITMFGTPFIITECTISLDGSANAKISSDKLVVEMPSDSDLTCSIDDLYIQISGMTADITASLNIPALELNIKGEITAGKLTVQFDDKTDKATAENLRINVDLSVNMVTGGTGKLGITADTFGLDIKDQEKGNTTAEIKNFAINVNVNLTPDEISESLMLDVGIGFEIGTCDFILNDLNESVTKVHIETISMSGLSLKAEWSDDSSIFDMLPEIVDSLQITGKNATLSIGCIEINDMISTTETLSLHIHDISIKADFELNLFSYSDKLKSMNATASIGTVEFTVDRQTQENVSENITSISMTGAELMLICSTDKGITELEAAFSLSTLDLYNKNIGTLGIKDLDIGFTLKGDLDDISLINIEISKLKTLIQDAMITVESIELDVGQSRNVGIKGSVSKVVVSLKDKRALASIGKSDIGLFYGSGPRQEISLACDSLSIESPLTGNDYKLTIDLNGTISIVPVLGKTQTIRADNASISVDNSLFTVKSGSITMDVDYEEEAAGILDEIDTVTVSNGASLIAVQPIELNKLTVEYGAKLKGTLNLDGYSEVQLKIADTHNLTVSDSTGYCLQVNFAGTNSPESIKLIPKEGYTKINEYVPVPGNVSYTVNSDGTATVTGNTGIIDATATKESYTFEYDDIHKNYYYGDSIALNTPGGIQGMEFRGWFDGEKITYLRSNPTYYEMPARNVVLKDVWIKVADIPEDVSDLVQDNIIVIDMGDSDNGRITRDDMTAIRSDVQNNNRDGMTIGTSNAKVFFDKNSASRLSGEISLTVKMAEPDENQKKVVGDNPIIKINLTNSYNGTIGLSGEAKVTFRHVLSDGESAEDIVVYYLDGYGRLTAMPTTFSVVDDKTVDLTFTTDHFSDFTAMDPSITPSEEELPIALIIAAIVIIAIVAAAAVVLMKRKAS